MGSTYGVQHRVPRYKLSRRVSDRRPYAPRDHVDEALVIVGVRSGLEPSRSAHFDKHRLFAPQELANLRRDRQRVALERMHLDCRYVCTMRER